jgi:hypothetical protein
MRVLEIVSKAESLDGTCRMLGSREYADLGRYLAKDRAEAACREARNN